MLSGVELVFSDGRAVQLWDLFSELHITDKPSDSDVWTRYPVAPR